MSIDESKASQGTLANMIIFIDQGCTPAFAYRISKQWTDKCLELERVLDRARAIVREEEEHSAQDHKDGNGDIQLYALRLARWSAAKQILDEPLFPSLKDVRA